jgi:hypothetical protein
VDPLFGLFGGLFNGFIGLWEVHRFFSPAETLITGLLCSLVAGYVAGGGACIKHYVLRFSLIRNGATPWNYVKFLDYCADRILLHKVGGGYMFIHRMLLEWFAERYVEPGTDAKKGIASENAKFD